MKLTNWLSHLTGKLQSLTHGKSGRSRSRQTQRPQTAALETLENRTLLTAITVTTLADGSLADLAGDGEISLREALEAANTDTSIDGSSAGSGADTIEFAAGLTGTIVLERQLTGRAELNITDNVTINGPGRDNLTIDANGANTSSRIFKIANAETVVINGLTLTNGKTSSGGGAIRGFETHLTVSDSRISGSVSRFDGGAIGLGGSQGTASLTVVNTSFSGNTSTEDAGGAIATFSPLVVSGSTFSDNTADGSGGAISSGSVTITDSTFSGNTTDSSGGAMSVEGGLSIAMISGSTFSGNSTPTSGGGALFIFGSAKGTLRNSTLVGNSALQFGGAIAVGGNATELTLIHSTVTGNSSLTSGGGIATLTNAKTTIDNSIIAGNSAIGPGQDVANLNQGIVETAFSFIGDESTEPTSTTFISNNLAATTDWKDVLENDGTAPILKDNGGPTETVALLPDSPAINAGSDALATDADGNPLSFDQRGVGFPRFSATADMGAFEAILNQPPSANAGGPYVVNEGGTIVLNASGSTDDEQDSATLSYAWDLDNDGLFDDATGQNPQFSAALLDGPSVGVVGLKVTDDGGLSDTTTVNVSVLNVAPELIVGTDASSLNTASADRTVVLSGQVTDAGVLDTHTVVVDWGDGSLPQTLVPGTGGLIDLQHTYADGGEFSVAVTATDDDGATSTSSATAIVQGLGLDAGVLTITGSSGRDYIHAFRVGSWLGVVSSFAGGPAETSWFEANSVQSIRAVLGAGDDHVNVSWAIAVPSIIDGGSGNDTLLSGSGNDTILGGTGNDYIAGGFGNDAVAGGDGNDIILGQYGRDVLIGGRGLDYINGGTGDDLLIGGSTVYDEDAEAISAIMSEWGSGNSYTSRISNIRSGTGLAMGNSLNAATTVFDDDESDILIGSTGFDWFFANSSVDSVWRWYFEELDDLF